MQTAPPAATEHLLREARLSWWSLWHQLALGIAGLALVAWGLMRQDPAGQVVAAVGALDFVWFFFGALIRRGSMKVALTDRYLVLESGLFSRHSSTVMLNRVESLDVDQNMWQRLGRYGTLTIRGTGSEDLRLAGLHDPVGFHAAARAAINAAGGAPV
jgi:hypothetical protein